MKSQLLTIYRDTRLARQGEGSWGHPASPDRFCGLPAVTRMEGVT